MFAVVFQEPAAIDSDFRIFKHTLLLFRTSVVSRFMQECPSDLSQAGLCHMHMSIPLFVLLCEFRFL